MPPPDPIPAGITAGCRLGKFVLLERLGYATGELFLALHERSKRRLTLQILGTDTQQEWDASHVDNGERVHRTWTVPPDHPNLVRVYDADEDRSTRAHFGVLEELQGKPLPSLLESVGGRLPVGEACGAALQVATGLEAVHESGLFHGRINPRNLFVCDNGTVKILHIWVWGFDPLDRLTRYRIEVWIDILYLAPECALEPDWADSDRVDSRCDCYSLGAVLYRMVCGEPPFASEAELVRRIVSLPRMLRAGVPRGLADVLTRMLELRPEQRYQSMAEVIDALRPFVRSDPSGRSPGLAAAAQGSG